MVKFTKKIQIGLARFFSLIVVLSLTAIWCRWNLTPKMTQVRIAIPRTPSAALIMLAEEKGFFTAHGLDAVRIWRDTDKECLDLLQAQQTDLVQASVTPVAFAAARGTRLELVTELYHSEKDAALLLRRLRDSARDKPSLLRIGVAPSSNGEFMLDLMLATRLLDLGPVERVMLPAKELAVALRDGQLDGAMFWEPYLSMVNSAHPHDFLTIYCPFYSEFSALLGSPGAFAGRAAIIDKLLAALKDAEDYSAAAPDETLAILRHRLRDQGISIAGVNFDNFHWRLGVSATYLEMLQEQTAWATHKLGGAATRAPSTVFVGRNLRVLFPEAITYE